MSAARSKPGCLTLPAMFVSRRLPMKKGAAKTAAEGQGGTDKKDPPEVIDVIAFVRGFAAHQVPGLEYKILSPTAIAIPARDGDRLKAAREAVKKNDNAVTQAELKAAHTIVDWKPIEEGKAITVKTFERQAARDLLSLCTVQLAALEAVFRSYIDKESGERRETVEFMCGLPVVMESRFSPKITLSEMIDLHQLPVQLPDANERYPGVMVAYFKDYARTIEDEDEGRGCVVSKMFNNDIRAEDYIYKPQDTKLASLLKMTYRMGQDQDDSNPAFPVQGLFGIQARFTEGGVKDQQEKILLRAAFGINDPKTWSEVMSAQSIPAIVAGSISAKDCQVCFPCVSPF